ncbi:MAG: GGDEF domain-containing protein [Solirubrobacterales bacterium]
MTSDPAQDKAEHSNDAQSDAAADAAHRPFRSWALQQDLISLIGSDADWRARTPELGIDVKRESDVADVPGQAFLQEALEPDQRFSVRTKTSIALWAAALVTDCLNQWGPTGIEMSPDAFRLTILSVLFALIFTPIVYPRLSPKPFSVVEQSFLGLAYFLIAYQCADTGGTESPYIVWLMFTTFYAAYLLPPRRAIANVAISVLVGLSTIFMAETGGGTYTAVILTALVVTSILLAGSILRQRRIERNVRRAVDFLAVADPLTGVANLRAFEQFVDRLTSRNEASFALLMVDMNGLKGANTVFGHEVGDGMVVRLAKLMLQASRPTDQVARIGGDEFAVVMAGGGESELEQWESDFSRLVADHNTRVRGRLPQISCATGSAVFPADGTTADELIDAADRQMLEQKTPAVRPPYEIDGPAPALAGRLLSSARFADTPARTYEPADVLGQAAANWLVVGGLTLLTLTLSGPLVTEWAAILVGSYGLLMAVLCLVALRVSKIKPLLIVIDSSTLFYGGFSLIATGGSESPIQLAALIPAAYYARYLRGGAAIIRVATLIGVYAIAFFGYGGVDPAAESLFATIVTAMIVITAIFQFSSGSLVDALRIVRESATHDSLTRAPNLHAFREDLAKVIEAATPGEVHQRRPALVIADIDGFRRLNVRSSHRGGDAILQHAVDRLRAEVGVEGRVYRIGGDELAVLFSVDRLADATEMAARCRRTLEFRSQVLPTPDQKVTASIGFAVWHESLGPAEFVETVETALGQSKEARGRTVPAGTNVML